MSCHPWKEYEADFQVVLTYLRTGIRTPELEGALKRINVLLLKMASIIFRSPRLRQVDCDPLDAVQNFLLHLSRLDGRGYVIREPFYPWGYKVFLRICLTMTRQGRRNYAFNSIVDRPGKALRPLSVIRSRERRSIVIRGVRQLPFKQRIAFVGQFWRGRTVKEAAERQGVSVSQISRWRLQARINMRAYLKGKGIDWRDMS